MSDKRQRMLYALRFYPYFFAALRCGHRHCGLAVPYGLLFDIAFAIGTAYLTIIASGGCLAGKIYNGLQT